MMFKNKSAIGITNYKQERFLNEHSPTEPLTPLKNTNKTFEQTFAKAKRAQNANLDRHATLAEMTLQRRHTQQFDLECDETLEILTNEPAGGGRGLEQNDENLFCEEELAPISRNPSRELNGYVQRLQNLLFEYMRRDVEKSQYIRKLEEERGGWEGGGRQEEARGKSLLWK